MYDFTTVTTWLQWLHSPLITLQFVWFYFHREPRFDFTSSFLNRKFLYHLIKFTNMFHSSCIFETKASKISFRLVLPSYLSLFLIDLNSNIVLIIAPVVLDGGSWSNHLSLLVLNDYLCFPSKCSVIIAWRTEIFKDRYLFFVCRIYP